MFLQSWPGSKLFANRLSTDEKSYPAKKELAEN